MFERLRKWLWGGLPEGSYRTKSGRVLHDEDFEALADEAERHSHDDAAKAAAMAHVTPVASTRLTDDHTNPGLRDIDPVTKMQKTYLVLSDEERAKGYVRPVRTSYVHEKCGTETTMGRALAETYARQPDFYGGTYCAGCHDHFPVGAEGEFVWADGSDEKVGT